MPIALQQILAWLAAAGLGATALVGVALGMFKLFGNKWLESKFDKQLEAYKHAQQRELEKLRLEINTQFDRVSKLHQHEFDVLPTLWTKLSESFGAVAQFVSPMQSYPDLNRMSALHLEEFLEKSELEKWQRAELLIENDKTTAYQKAIFWHRLRSVRKSCASYHNYLITNGIFIQPDLKSELSAMSDLLHDAVTEKEFEEQYPAPRKERFAKSERVRKEGPKMLKDIEGKVYARLWRDVPSI
jgi:hypothetical protein